MRRALPPLCSKVSFNRLGPSGAHNKWEKSGDLIASLLFVSEYCTIGDRDRDFEIGDRDRDRDRDLDRRSRSAVSVFRSRSSIYLWKKN